MSNKQFFNNLSATYADVRKLDVKKINLKGKSILEHIKDGKTVVLDERGTNVTPYDLWGTRVETAEDGTVTVYHELIDASVKKYEAEKNGWNFPYGLYESYGWHIMGGGYEWFESLVLQNDESREDYKWTLIDNKLYKDGEFVANIQTNMIEKAESMFGGSPDEYRARLFEFNSDLSNLTDGADMFAYCHFLTSFDVDLPSLTDGSFMFNYCPFESFNSDLSSLTNGECMFGGCNNLKTFSSDLSSLTNGSNMFNYSNLESFNADLSSLTDGSSMFNNTDIVSFSSNLSSLTNGVYMFGGCNNLKTFSSDLSSLTNGERMFNYCKLDAKSVSNIIQSLQMGNEPDEENTYEISIGIGCDDTEEDRLLFAEECHCETWQELLDEFSAKNWTVTFQYNGRPTTTYNMRRGESLPVFVKIEEVIMPTEGERLRKPHYTHTSIDGSKYYQMAYFHSTNGSTDGYSQFNSIEEAEQHFEITPKQQIER